MAGSTPSSPSAGGLVLGEAWKCPGCPQGCPRPAQALPRPDVRHSGGFAWTPRGSGGRPRPHLLAPATPTPLLKGPRSQPRCPSWSGPCVCGTLAPGWGGGSPSPNPRLNQWRLWQRLPLGADSGGGHSWGSSHNPGAPSLAGGASRGRPPTTPHLPPQFLRAGGAGGSRKRGFEEEEGPALALQLGCLLLHREQRGEGGSRLAAGSPPALATWAAPECPFLLSVGTRADSATSALPAPTHVRVQGPDSERGAPPLLPHQPPGTKGQGLWEQGGSRGALAGALGAPVGNPGSQHPKQPGPQGGLGPGRERGAGLASGCRSARGTIRHTRVCTRAYVHVRTCTHRPGGKPHSGPHALQAPLNPGPVAPQHFPEQPPSMGPGAWRQGEASPVTSPTLLTGPRGSPVPRPPGHPPATSSSCLQGLTPPTCRAHLPGWALPVPPASVAPSAPEGRFKPAVALLPPKEPCAAPALSPRPPGPLSPAPPHGLLPVSWCPEQWGMFSA